MNMIQKILVDHDNNISVLVANDISDINEEHKKSIKKILDVPNDTVKGMCEDDLGANIVDCWVYDDKKDVIKINRHKLVLKHLTIFRGLREQVLVKIDYMLIDATATRREDEINRLIELKRFLRDYPDMILSNSDKYTIDYLKTQPSELFI